MNDTFEVFRHDEQATTIVVDDVIVTSNTTIATPAVYNDVAHAREWVLRNRRDYSLLIVMQGFAAKLTDTRGRALARESMPRIYPGLRAIALIIEFSPFAMGLARAGMNTLSVFTQLHFDWHTFSRTLDGARWLQQRGATAQPEAIMGALQAVGARPLPLRTATA